MQLAEFGNVDKVSACFQLRLSALKMKTNGAIAGEIFFPYISLVGLPQLVLHIFWGDSLEKKIIEQFFSNFPQFNVPY